MLTAKLFENGRSQAVRLPKEFRFDGDEVIINKVGNIVMLVPKNDEWGGFIAGLSMFTDDFMNDGRVGNDRQERDSL
ncbi:type II toxin-antitoxin system antitoxin VapB [Veillonella agrestimuris]|uniref:type II toxin-antitoxin system antitoxin VapB n=1 Tax=Veillonella agrestimuris TaxID=2941340 RepID=UPI00203B3063|nr:type II toxin-antitoxin system VapB family antitoxin [Veillonella agrestimuris]